MYSPHKYATKSPHQRFKPAFQQLGRNNRFHRKLLGPGTGRALHVCVCERVFFFFFKQSSSVHLASTQPNEDHSTEGKNRWSFFLWTCLILHQHTLEHFFIHAFFYSMYACVLFSRVASGPDGTSRPAGWRHHHQDWERLEEAEHSHALSGTLYLPFGLSLEGIADQ